MAEAAAQSADDLQRQLTEQRDLIDAQRAMLQQQQERIDAQSLMLEALIDRVQQMAASLEDASQQIESTTVDRGVARTAGERPAGGTVTPTPRDGVGDLNAEAIRAGEFPGSFHLPGDSPVSLGIGGFIKVAAIHDSDANTMGSDFIPAQLGAVTSDRSGAFSVDSTLSRFEVDGRAPLPLGHIRGYLEHDLNGRNDGSLDIKMRHAFGAWDTGNGTLLAGHTWSTMMDLGILPEGLTEPTVSGVIFNRQSQIRWSQPLSEAVTYHLAIEDPSSNDVFSDLVLSRRTPLPDAVAGVEYHAQNWHLRLNGIGRKFEVETDTLGSDAATAWGLGLTGHLDLPNTDRVRFSGIYGEGLGRYLLGIQASSGAILDSDSAAIELRDTGGAMLSYLHPWTSTLRTTAMIGYARAKPLDWQAADVFESSRYGSINLMWSTQPYMTVGVEYAYGESENNGGDELSNHRIAFGIQIF